jgi:hypothetical protein
VSLDGYDGTYLRLTRRRKVGVGLVAVALGVIIWRVNAWVGTHITDCGFDANGAYAEVRADLLGGQEVWVDFYLDGRPFTYAGSTDVHWSTVLRAPFPREDFHVSGRTVYVDTHHRYGKFVTRKFAQAHPGRTLTEVAPDAWHTLSCRFDYTDPD